MVEEKKRWTEDPTEHCEGDTVVEDIFVQPKSMETSKTDVVALQALPISTNRNCEIATRNEKCEITMGDEDDLCPEDDDGAEVPIVVRKRKRPRRMLAPRNWFDETKMLDHSHICEGMCFQDVKQFRKALHSYHIVQMRDFNNLRNDPDQVRVVCDLIPLE